MSTKPTSTRPSKDLETFANPHPGHDYIIEITAPEFTCLCPKTGQPDFATLYMEYVPDKLCVELKSYKLYIWSYRNEGQFHEDVTNQILADLVKAVSPRYMRLRAEFYVRGGVYTNVEVEHRKNGWKPLPAVPTNLPRQSAETDTSPTEETTAPAQPPMPPAASLITPAPVAQPSPTASAASPVPAAPTPGRASERFRMLTRGRRVEVPPTGARAAQAEAPVAPTAPAPAPKTPKTVFIGIDFGTTGCRACATNAQGTVLAEAQAPIPHPMRQKDQITQDPTLWWKAASHCLQHILKQVDPAKVHSIAVVGTSGTLLLTDEKGAPVTPAIMYNDQRATEEAEAIAAIADEFCGAHGPTSSLAKLLWLQSRKLNPRTRHALHQADWIAGHLTGLWGHSDYANCLKLGFDQQNLTWPAWFADIGVNEELLPTVHASGEPLGTVSPEIAKQFNLPNDTLVVAGTTDGVAAFLAAGANAPGHGVTSLGSTLVLKLLSNNPVFSPEHGVYSHRLGKSWLVGGASNSGGATLLQYFKVEQMNDMAAMLDPEHFTDLGYYPLPGIGERFPINDPAMEPKLEPLPTDSVTFFQGMLEGIAHIETMGYNLLHQHGAPKVTAVWTTGGGARNAAWTRIRQRMLGVHMHPARSTHSAYGAALLASGVLERSF